MEKQEKQEIIYLLEGCKSFEVFNEITRNFNKKEKLYAQCWWICNQYQHNRDKDKENKLSRILSKYNIDLDNIKEFIKTNIKHTDIDRHIANIIKLDERLNNEKEILKTIDYIGENAIRIIPIENPSIFEDEHEDVLKFFEGYRFNYYKFHKLECNQESLAFGRYMKVKKVQNDKINDINTIILSNSVVKKGFFDTIKRECISKFVQYPVECTKNLVKEYSLEILNKLDDNGIIKRGSIINKGDILIGCNAPDYDAVNTPEYKLLSAIFGDKGIPQKDVSIINEEFNGIISDVIVEKIKGGIKVDIIIDIKLGVEIGDTLGDINFNKGKIVEIISPEIMKQRFGFEYDIVSNFNLQDYVLRYSPIVSENINYSVGEKYSYDNQKPIDYNKFCKPMDIDENIINKFNDFNILDCLSEIINYSKLCSSENLVKAQIMNNGKCFLKRDDSERISYLKYYFLILGFKIDVIEDSIRLKKLTNDELLKLSYGEITNPETYNYRSLKPEPGGLFCEKVFGPEISYQCYCHKYNGLKYKGTICERCGVEVCSNDARFIRCGHIKLESEIVSIFGEKIENLIVIPPLVRPFITSKVSESINNYYKVLINKIRKIKRLSNYVESDNFSDKLKNSEISNLQEIVTDFQNYILSLIIYLIKGYVNTNKIIYSVKGCCVFDENVSNEKCLIPKEALFSLMKPYIVNVLSQNRVGDVQKLYNNLDSADSNIMKIFEDVLKDKKFLVFSDSKEGVILNLKADISQGNSIILSKENYEKVCSNNDIVSCILPLTENCKQIIEKNLNLKKNVCELFNYKSENDIVSEIFLTTDDRECKKIFIKYLKENSEIKLNSRLSKSIIETLV